MSDLPENWIEVPLPELSTIEMGQSPDSSTYNDQGKGLPFFQGKAEFGKLYPTVRKWCSQPKKIAEAGDILLSVRAPVGPTNLALEKCCIGRGLAAIRAKEHINQKYLLHYFRNIEPWLTQQGTGSTFTAISGGFIRELQIPLAPLNEQKRIAEKLNSLLARVDSCQAHLERVPQILKRFRQSVLAAATSGRLTEDWREKNSVNGEWETTIYIIRDVGEVVTGSTPKKANNEYYGGDIPFYKPTELDAGYYVADSTEHLTKLGAEQARMLPERTVLVTCIGATIGKVGFARKAGATNQQINSVIANVNIVLPEFLFFWFSSPIGQSSVIDNSSATTLPIINKSRFSDLEIELPPLEEQAEIVRRVEKLFAYAERLEARYTSASEHVERLTPSLLAKAFRGELVEQDAGDESAEELLKRIHAVIANTPKESKKSERRSGMKSAKSRNEGKRISVIQALEDAGKELSSEQLFAAVGFPVDAGSDLVEEFFVEIRDALEKKQVKRKRKDNSDWFLLSK